MHWSKVYRAVQRLEDLQKEFKGIIYDLAKHWLMESVSGSSQNPCLQGSSESISYPLIGPAVDTMTGWSLSCSVNQGTEHET